MYQTKRPKEGSPWIVPAREAKGPFVHTERGIAHLTDFVSPKDLRPDQLLGRSHAKMFKGSIRRLGQT